MARRIYRGMRYGQAYVDIGEEQCLARRRERMLRSMRKNISKLSISAGEVIDKDWMRQTGVLPEWGMPVRLGSGRYASFADCRGIVDVIFWYFAMKRIYEELWVCRGRRI